MNWIIDNQLGRRNLTGAQRSYLRGKRYEKEKKVDKGNQYTKPESASSKTYYKQKTVEKIADQNNVSPKTISNDFMFSKAIDEVRETEPELAQKILTEEVLISKKDVVELVKIESEDHGYTRSKCKSISLHSFFRT